MTVEESAAEHPDPPPGRFGALDGTVTCEGAAATRGDDIEPGDEIVVPAGGSASILMRDGARVVLEAGSKAQLNEEGAAQVLLVTGSAHLTQPASGNSPRPPLRVATPAVTVEISAAGEAYVQAFEAGSAWVAVLSGDATVQTASNDNLRRLATVAMAGGQASTITDRVGELGPGPRTLADARQTGRLLQTGAPPAEAELLRRGARHDVRRLDDALRWLEAETRLGPELSQQHRAAVREGEEQAAEIQRALVDHSRKLYRLRRLAVARWERVKVRVLLLEHLRVPLDEDPNEQRRGRVAGLLGFAALP